jgi:hypothetical protein
MEDGKKVSGTSFRDKHECRRHVMTFRYESSGLWGVNPRNILVIKDYRLDIECHSGSIDVAELTYFQKVSDIIRYFQIRLKLCKLGAATVDYIPP